SGPASHAANSSLAVTAGTVNLNSNQGTAATAGSAALANLAVTIGGAGSSVVANADQSLRSLLLSTGDSGTQGFDLNTPAGAGQFRSIHVYAADLSAAKTSLYAAIRNALANPGDGIYDSGLAAHGGAARLGLGVVADAHGDLNVFIRTTRLGDVNLDGQTTIADFIDLASHFNQPGTWQEGDVNYDGQVTGQVDEVG